MKNNRGLRNRSSFSLGRVYKGTLDLLMVLGATVATMSLVNYVTLEFTYLPAGLNWLIFTLVCYFLRFGSFSSKTRFYGRNPLLFFFFVIILWEAIQAGLLGRTITFTYFVEFASYFVFLRYFVRATNEYQNIDVITKPYIVFGIYSCAIIFISAFLIGAGILSPTDNPIPEGRFRFMNENISTGSYYFWPGHLSISAPDARIPLPWEIPVLCGLSHEPHVLCHSIFPALLLMLYYFRKKKLLTGITIISIIAVLVLSFSTTALISLLVVLFLEVIVYNIHKKSFTGFILPILLIAFLVIVFVINSDVVSAIFTYSSNKISGGDTTSMRYSSNMILYSLSPSSLLGDGIYLDVTTTTPNIGLISSFLIVTFFIYFVIIIFRNYFSRIPICHYIGLASLYFFVHSLKMGCLILNYPLLFYILFILSYSEMIRKRNKPVRNLVNSNETKIQ